MPGSRNDIKGNISSVKEIYIMPVKTRYEINFPQRILNHIFCLKEVSIFCPWCEIMSYFLADSPRVRAEA